MNAQDLLTSLGRTSLQAGVLVVVILVVRWVFQRQLTAQWRASLWLLVVARLVVPFSPESAVSIFNLVPVGNRPNVTEAVVGQAADVTTDFPRPNRPDRLASSVAGMEPNSVQYVPNPGLPFVDSLPVSATAAAPSSAVRSRLLGLARISGWTWAFWAWLLGIGVLSAHVLRGFFRLQRHFRTLPAPADVRVQQLLTECARQLGVRRIPRLRESNDVLTPALFGFLRP